MFIRSLWTKHNIRKKNLARRKFLNQVIPKGGTGAELGVHKGYFTRCILDEAKPCKLHLIDPWYLQGPEWKWDVGNRSTIDALRGLLRTYKTELVNGTVVLNIGEGLEVLGTFDDGYFDWVYVDTTHSYEQTRKELEILKTKVKADGIIAGDDWLVDPGHIHHGVCRAVREFVEKEPYTLLYEGETDFQWAIRRKEQ